MTFVDKLMSIFVSVDVDGLDNVGYEMENVEKYTKTDTVDSNVRLIYS